MADDHGGTYVLHIDLTTPATIEFGAAGTVDLDSGRYAYVGSAFGPGGLSRVDRHRELAIGERDARHWHVDYLLGHPESAIVDVQTWPGLDAECDIAAELGRAGRVLPLGASDCDCEGHLVVEPHETGVSLYSLAREAEATRT